ncbi:stage VI sporulation protein F [Paenibacillus sp. 481]|uniref:stage VI sporulation protein F n=1 Tax=Paenibacillus sp. 481 TaxID=2835869 RepID=UPI001E496997|nr:stage VI sporulation protein F [Paenibacillus sp. 481]UHA72950.1 stage VI sporulation protein F [Paenibacillus sp. 481]
MSNDKFPKDALNAINKKVGKPITENQIKQIAGNVKPSTLTDEAQLRQLIKQVAAMANLPVSESTVNDIVNTVKRSGVNANSLETLMKLISKR